MNSLLGLIRQFPQQRILVLGDLILDHYLRGSVTRTSPEAPVPVLAVEDEDWLPGGAANVAKNLVSLGSTVDLVGLVGKDDAADKLRTILRATKRLKATLLPETDRPTIVKSRAVSQGQQMLRLDREVIRPASARNVAQALAFLDQGLAEKKWNALILSDYGKGFLQPEFIQQIVQRTSHHGVPVFVDPKGRDYSRYRGVSVLTPNQKEATEASGIAVADDATAAKAAQAIQKSVRSEAVVITRGASGVSVFPSKGEPVHMPAQAREVFDVTGAGDTFLSVLTLSRVAGANWSDAAQLANYAAGVVVGMAGVAAITTEALVAACAGGSMRRRKVLSEVELTEVLRSHRQNGARIVFTNGFFDLLHHSHLRLLEEARGMGDVLVVALNSDASTRRLKGAPRPILRLAERAEMLAAFPYVDYIVEFSDDTPERLLQLLKPDILVKGAASGGATAGSPDAVGRQIVEGYGGTVRLVSLDGSISIAELLARAVSPAKPTRKKRP